MQTTCVYMTTTTYVYRKYDDTFVKTLSSSTYYIKLIMKQK